MTEHLSAEAAMKLLTRRYGADPTALMSVLCPLLVPIRSLDKKAFVSPGQKHFRASFTVQITDENFEVMIRGRTGKFVPAMYGGGEPGWREIAKGRITSVDYRSGIAKGEIYLGFGGGEAPLALALEQLSEKDFLEIDQYGAAAKALSGLTEYYLVKHLRSRDFAVVRMPEDMASHLGHYANFDFLIKKDKREKRLEVKSLWGTDTRYARLIHSTTTKPKNERKHGRLSR